MSKKVKFADICMRLAAARCYRAGQSIQRIALSAKKPLAVIRKWLEDTHTPLRKEDHREQRGRRQVRG